MSSPVTLLKSLRTRLDGRRRDLRADVRPGSGALAYADGRRAAVGLVLAAGLLGAFLLLAGSAVTAEAQGDECENAEFRTGRSAQLPDCRAYEQVTPVDKGEQDAPLLSTAGTIYDPAVSSDGNRAAYTSQGAFAGSPTANTTYIASRSDSAWSSQGVLPRQSVITYFVCAQGAVTFAEDLSQVVVVDGAGQVFGCGVDDPKIDPDEPEGVANLFHRDTETGNFQLLTPKPVTGPPDDAQIEGGSPDMQHVVFSTNAQLTPDASTGGMLYASSAGGVRLLSRVPAPPATECIGSSCVTVGGAGLGGAYEGTGQGVFRVARAVSTDGSRVFFHATPPGGTESLYMREGSKTVQIDASQGGPDTGGGGQFMTAAADGSSVFFTAETKLTPDATASTDDRDLYRYDVATGELTDLTVDDVDGAGVLGVLGASDDGSRIYFVANGVLAANSNSEGDTPSSGDCQSGSAGSGACNLYVAHGGSIEFIATLAGTDQTAWGINTSAGPPSGTPYVSRVTPDGQRVVFNSTRSLTGYDNTPVDPSACSDSSGDQSPCSEIFLYDAGSSELECVSCNSSGPPAGASWLSGGSSHIVAWSGPKLTNLSLPRNLSDDGSRVFFSSDDSLVSADTNHRQDVYVWEDGDVQLISSGRDDGASQFFGASADGDSAFFITRERLLPQDSDDLLDLYDARVNGGLASQNQPPPPPPCTGDSCKGDQSAPPAEEPNGSGEFTGPGNQATNAARCVRKGERAQRLAKKVKRAKRQVRRAHGKRAKRQARRKLRQSKHRYRRAQRRSVRCERGAR